MAHPFSIINSRVGYSNLPVTGVKTAAKGHKSITVAAADCSNTTLDLAVAATSGITGDRVLNYDSVHIAAGTISTGNCTLTLGNGDYVGQMIEIVSDGTMTTNDIVITITNFVGAGGTITMDAAGEGLLAVWTGTDWQVLVASVAS